MYAGTATRSRRACEASTTISGNAAHSSSIPSSSAISRRALSTSTAPAPRPPAPQAAWKARRKVAATFPSRRTAAPFLSRCALVCAVSTLTQPHTPRHSRPQAPSSLASSARSTAGSRSLPFSCLAAARRFVTTFWTSSSRMTSPSPALSGDMAADRARVKR